MQASRYEGVYLRKGKKGVSIGIRYTDPRTGQQIRKTLRGVTSEKEASKLRAIEIADLERGHLDEAYSRQQRYKPLRFEVMAKQWLKVGAGHYKDLDTIRYRVRVLNRYFGNKLLSDITPWSIEKFRMARAKEASKKTVNTQHSVLKQILDKAIEWKKMKGPNPAAQVKQFKLPKPLKPGAWTPEQAHSVIQAIPCKARQDMGILAYFSGFRIGEIRSLKWANVHLTKGTAVIEDPKNRQSVELELAPEALEVIERQPKRGEYVFCRRSGSQFSKSALNRTLKSAAEKAGVTLPPRKKWHMFRRTWASNMLQSGCDVETLRVMGNWKDISQPLFYAEAAGSTHRREILANLPKLEISTNLAQNEKVVSLSA